MAMANFNFASMAAKESVEQGISFQDKAETWNTAVDVKAVVDELNSKTPVHFLNLDGNTLGVEAAEAIGEALKRHPEFRKALWKNLFTRRLKSEIPLALQHLGAGLIAAGAKLTVLDLSDNALGPNGMRGLEEFLRSPVLYSLQELYLNNCGLGPEGGRMLATALIDLYENAKAAGSPLQLRIFVAGRNRLENVGAKALSLTLKTLQTLEEISMPQNSIYHVGISALAEGFKMNPHLRLLNMNDNTVTAKGSAKIAEVFEHTPLLREINFGDCLLKTDGAYMFAEALERNHVNLEVLDLSYNEINDDAGLMIITAIQNKPNLKKLYLDGNTFGREGCAQIIAQMAHSLNPNALMPFEEDVSAEEGDESGQDDEQDDDNDTAEYADDDYDENEEDEYDPNDTTEEVDEEEDEEEYGKDNSAEETAYVTTNNFPPKLFNDTVGTGNNTFAFGNNGNTIAANTSCTPAEFCLSQTPCSLQQFNSLEADKLLSLNNIINQFNGDDHLLLLVFTTLKCAHLSKTSKPALDLAISLYQATFDYAIQTNQETRVLDYVLKQLGLLRSEEHFKTDYDVKSCRYALREALEKQQFANDNIKNTFKLFLEKLDV
ncbi:ran GTPase-activating protein [Drosophila nasuta]|uniref:Ran GTPase-activating protein isoform X1 n=1 Tax=Drosophila albomicans TaxID=7291 RepID=A0A9C6SZM5_DROAB|nr:ran GTPase-activating protein isoform X1 [Drosophila albomicans]XP_051858798.1 ran GTPase-activating protein isoform X2 [Drosophila albomicans]XP_060666510.1 ran GTPase-activating protein [Drosophila nasuta]